MARSKRDRPGKRTNGEVWGRGTAKLVDDRIVAMCGGEEVGSPARKREAKERVTRQRRAADREAEARAIAEACR